MAYSLILILLNFMLIFVFKSDLLMMLISMQFFVISMLLMIFMFEIYSNEWIFMYFMVFSVCDSVIGLSILVNCTYFYGNQSISMLNLTW